MIGVDGDVDEETSIENESRSGVGATKGEGQRTTTKTAHLPSRPSSLPPPNASPLPPPYSLPPTSLPPPASCLLPLLPPPIPCPLRTPPPPGAPNKPGGPVRSRNPRLTLLCLSSLLSRCRLSRLLLLSLSLSPSPSLPRSRSLGSLSSLLEATPFSSQLSFVLKPPSSILNPGRPSST